MTKKFLMHKSRLEALVDGVFAIAMTILVLEVKVPVITDQHSATELLNAIVHDGLVIAAYFFSFGMLGMFWVWHHRLTATIKEIDLPLLVCSLSFLSLICFFPFAAALFGRYFFNVTAHFIYLPLMGLILINQTFFYWLAMRRKLILESVSAEDAIAAHRRNLMGCAIFFVLFTPNAVRLSVWLAIILLAIGVAMFWHIWKLKAVRLPPPLSEDNSST